MNANKSPDPPSHEAGGSGSNGTAVAQVNGHGSPKGQGNSTRNRVKSSPYGPSQDQKKESPSAKSSRGTVTGAVPSGNDDGGDSEAETLIDSPVKKDAETQQGNTTRARPPKHRIGGLPVPAENDDDNDSAAVSPAASTAMSVDKTTSTEDVKDRGSDTLQRAGDDDDDDDDDSDSLSSARSNDSNPRSRESSISRAASERPGFSRDNAHSPNPRKRKHRASSVNLPNKRPSMSGPKGRLRGLHSEELNGSNERSASPKLRSHRRAVSTQSALPDGNSETANRKRKSSTQGPSKDTKAPKNGWEESDASSETTSHGHVEHRRAQRAVGRSTSTPGRPIGQHKRHMNKYGFTRLAEACEDNDLESVRKWREEDPGALEIPEFAGNKPLQIAALNGNVDVVDYLIEQGCQIDCANVDKDTPLIDAAENGHLDVVNSLLRAGVDPLRQNLKGQQALDAVTDETEDADEIRASLRKAIDEWNSTGAKQRREEEEENRHRAGPTKELHFMARTYENLLKLVQNNDRSSVQEFLDARVPVDNAVIAAAAKTGDSYLVNMLLVELPEKKRGQKPERLLLSVLGTSHMDMVRSLTELDNFDPLYRDRQGRSWPEIAEQKNGPNWRQEKEHLQGLFDAHVTIKERRSSSPVTKRDSLKRRLINRPNDEGENSEEELPRRKKNGRKLMSKRELRVAKGRADSDDASDASSAEEATESELIEETSMPPPETSVNKRTPTRSRTKSNSMKSESSSPRLRRRSSSVRAPNDQLLPTVEEKAEDKSVLDERREAEARRAAEEVEAQKRKLERQEREAVEAKAAAKQAAEEEERKADERRKAEEARRQEEERKAREKEEARKRKEQEMEASRAHREQIISSLPRTVSRVLDPSSGFDCNGPSAPRHLILHFAPLQVLRWENAHSSQSTTDREFWVVNTQAAPLLGKRGIELMLREDVPGFQNSLADAWQTIDVLKADIPIIQSIMSSLPQDLPNHEPAIDQNGMSTLPFDEEIRRTGERFHAAAEAKHRVQTGAAVLRLVRLADVLANLCPALQHVPVEVRFDHLKIPTALPSQPKESRGLFEILVAAANNRPRPRTYLDGEIHDLEDSPLVGSVQCTVRHEK